MTAHVINAVLSQLFDVSLKFKTHLTLYQVALLATISKDFINFVNVNCEFETWFCSSYLFRMGFIKFNVVGCACRPCDVVIRIIAVL